MTHGMGKEEEELMEEFGEVWEWGWEMARGGRDGWEDGDGRWGRTHSLVQHCFLFVRLG